MLASKELTGRYMHDSDLGPDSNVILAVTVTGYWVGGRSKFQVMFFVLLCNSIYTILQGYYIPVN